MPFRKLKPTSPGTRFQSVPTFEEVRSRTSRSSSRCTAQAAATTRDT
jgi:ribosomal protein L2